MPLKFKVWLYFMLFIVAVFGLLWFFQIFFLENLYETMRVSASRKSMEIIDDAYDKYWPNDKAAFYKTMDSVASKNDVCIEVLDRYGREIKPSHVLGECVLHGKMNKNLYLISKINETNDGVVSGTIINPKTNADMLVFGCVLGDTSSPDGYLLINSALVPVGATTDLIKRQLLLITVILIPLAFAISIYLSRRLALPIDRITASAENLAKGDFNTKFDGRGYLETKQLADTLTYAEKELSKVDTMQRDLIANVSHDLRTPLTMLKAYAEMIRDLSGDNPVKRNEHLEIIISETDRLALLVNDMLDLSKLESGKQKLNPSEFGISSKLSEIMDRFRGLSEKNGYKITFTPDEERTVYCDVVKIEQVIYNLINNAINYTGKDKKVFVRQINTEDGVIVEVEDTGDGIEEDKIKLIFDKYYRSENHKREVVGTGLGLSIVKAVLKMHNYDYGVRSTLGKGSTFWFKISDVKKQ
ncbi:sensor histidine kinase [Ruminococcus flavefaciens]|nr:HAMP domain-containing sensor histidine kinase [Ruminococcus flavefaciens]